MAPHNGNSTTTCWPVREMRRGVDQAAAVGGDRLRSRVTGVFGSINYGVRPIGAVAGRMLAG